MNSPKNARAVRRGRRPAGKNLIKMDDSLEPRSQLAAEKCVSLAPGVRRITAGNAGL
jgi:hypothetical protein